MQTTTIWVRRDKAYLPTKAEAESGYWVDVEPIYVSDLNEESLTAAIDNVLAQGNPKVPDLTDEEFLRKDEPLLKKAGVASVEEFERGAIAFSVTWNEDATYLYTADASSQFRFESASRRDLPPETPTRVIAQTILQHVQENL